MKNIKFVIWDMGGVIYDWSAVPFYKWCVENSSNKKKCNNILRSFDFNPHMSGIQSDEEMAKELCTFCHIAYKKGIEKDITKAMMDGNGKEFEVTNRLMKYVLGKGIKNALLSNASRCFSMAWMNDELVDDKHRFFSFDLGMVKPDLQIYKIVKNKLDAEFDELVFIDDRIDNVEAAISLGINGILFDEATVEDDLKKLFSN